MLNLSKVLQMVMMLSPIFYLCFISLRLANLVIIAAIKAAIEGAEGQDTAHKEFAKCHIMGNHKRPLLLSSESRKACPLTFSFRASKQFY
jgi:hypothetical protein